MKKRILTVILTLTAAVSLVACGGKGDSTTAETKADGSGKEATTAVTDVNKLVKDELVQFINVDIPSIASERDTAVAIYNAYFTEGVSNQDEWLEKLKNEAVVDYEVYLQSLKNLSYQSTEVQELQSTYIAVAQPQFEAIKYVISAIENKDVSQLDAAKDQIDSSYYYLKQYNEQLEQVCQKYGIKINGKEIGATDTDATTEEATEAETEATEEVAE